MPDQPRSILAIDASPFCRSLAMLPALAALRAAYHQARLVVAASRGTCEVVAVSGLASETVDLGPIKSGDHGFALKSFMKLLGVTRREWFDLVLDFSPGIEGLIATRLGRRTRLVTLSKAPHLIDFLFSGRRSSRAENHAAECAKVLRQIGLKPAEQYALATLPGEEDKRFEQVLARHGSKGGEPIVVLYGSSTSVRRGGAAECLSEVGVRLANNFGARIVAVDEPSSRAFTDSVAASLLPGAIKMVSPRALEVAAAIARASMVITDEPDLVNLTAGFRTPMLEVRYASGRSYHSRADRVVSAAPGRPVADDVFEAACEMIQGSRLPSLFQR